MSVGGLIQRLQLDVLLLCALESQIRVEMTEGVIAGYVIQQ